MKLKMNVTLCFLALYNDVLRNKFFDEIITKYNFFNDLDVKSKILFLFNNIDPFICKSVAAFIFEIMNCRHDHVISKVTKPILIIIIYFFKRIGNLFIYLFIYRFVQCTGERTIGHVVPYLVHPPNPMPCM